MDDIEIVLEPNVKTIRERPLFPPGVQGSKYRAHGSHHHESYHGLTSAPNSEEDGGDDEEDDDADHGGGGGGGNRHHRSSSYHHGSNRKRGASSNMQGSIKLPRMGDYGNGKAVEREAE